MRVLITGVAGLTGAHLARLCLYSGDTVVGVDDCFRGTEDNISELFENRDFEFIKCDFRDYIDNTSDTFDGIYHLAAIVPTQYFYKDPCLTYEVNCHGAYAIFKWAVANKTPRFINASSSEIYGHAKDYPTKETASSIYDSVETTTRWSYAHGKIMTEYLLNHSLDKIQVCHLRYANVYGEYDVDENHVIPYILNCIINDKQCVLNENAGLVRRSFLYMSDCAEATRLAMLRMRNGIGYNIGNPEETTILNLFNLSLAVARELGVRYEKEPCLGLMRPGDPTRRVLDISRAKEHLGYAPKVMLREGLMRTAAWMLKKSR
jgi:nucleoside-diphosphate-sugar epimerase